MPWFQSGEGVLAMRRITQHCDPENGCGIACVAMLLGITYADARKRLFLNGGVRLTQTRDLIAILPAGGRECGGRLIPLSHHETC